MHISRIHVLLFISTVCTTLITGYTFTSNVYDALLFSVSIILILGCHEMGHYYYGKKYDVDITPPYFIPAPPILSIIGTFGAFIKIRSPITSKKALFDIGIAGPIAGIIIAIPIIIIGLKLSTVISVDELTKSNGLYIITGDTLIFEILSRIVMDKLPPGFDYLHHPMAFAGWIGLFVTALNLIPFGQLDGGHILYSLFTDKIHKTVSYIMQTLLLVLGIGTSRLLEPIGQYYPLIYQNRFIQALIIDGWTGWLVWAVLLMFLGARHPRTLTDNSKDIDFTRKLLAIIALIIFIGCFTPVPLIISQTVN